VVSLSTGSFASFGSGMVFITVAVYSAKDQRLALRFTGLHGTLFAWRKPEAIGPPVALVRSSERQAEFSLTAIYPKVNRYSEVGLHTLSQ